MRSPRNLWRSIRLCFFAAISAGLGAFGPVGVAGDVAAASANAKPAVLVDMANKRVFTFLGFDKRTESTARGVQVQAPDARGGFTCPLGVDMSAYADWTPRLTLTLGPSNKLAVLSVSLNDADGTKYGYRFSLAGVAVGVETTVPAMDGASLREPGSVGAPGKVPGLDLAHLAEVNVLGTFMSDPVDLTLARIDLVPPDETLLAARAALRARLARETEAKRKAETAEAKHRADMLAGGALHPTNGAHVVNIGAVATDILGIEIQSGEYTYGAMTPYTAQPDDRQTGGSRQWVARDGKLVEATVGQLVERKDVQGKFVHLGVLSFDGKWVLKDGAVADVPLDAVTIEAPAAYEIQSVDDPAFATPVSPTAVYRKSKPNSPSNMAILHKLYLKLPSPLKDDAAYTVRFKGVNTREATVAYTHDTRVVRSDAVHVTHAGYRPDDPFKRGYLSLWMGTGGACRHTNVDTFELVDAQTGKTVFTGKPERGKVNEVSFSGAYQQTDYTMTPVYWLDFSAFRTPGTYRIRVPGIGASYPFPIADTAWETAFKIGMRGILSQRSGIALGPPFLDFQRPRPCHPDDGVKFYQTDINISDGQEGARGEALLRLWKANGKLDEVKGLWGGYQDAGDWDVYTTTLVTADELTDAYEISGDYGKRIKLSLPKAEAENQIPDLLDEALWGLAAFRRLQLPSGAVRDGYGDGWGARNGDVSWDDSNPVCVYAASPGTSWLYASVAARMARLLAPYDQAQASAYGESAARAWKWAAAQATNTAVDLKNPAWLHQHAAEAAAAVALYQLTREPGYHERFKQISELQEAKGTNYSGGSIEPLQQPDATFFYARLPDDLADPVLKPRARDRYVLAGNVAVYFMQHNAFNLATANSGMPMREFCAFFTNPGMGAHIVRAHALTHDPRYLEAIVASTGFELGANPDNMAFTTGIGPNPIRFPLKLDSLRTGQPAPAGITVYGPSDESRPSGMSDWVYTWVLTKDRMVPGGRTWPPPESYADVFSWPGANEYCVHSPLTSAVCAWCYLAARP